MPKLATVVQTKATYKKHASQTTVSESDKEEPGWRRNPFEKKNQQ